MTCHKCKVGECVDGLKVCEKCRELLRSNGMTNHHRRGYKQLHTGARPKRSWDFVFVEPFAVSGPAGRKLTLLNAESGW